MDNNFISALIATVLTCVLLIALMSAGLVQVALENKRYKIINAFIIAFLTVSLMASLFVLMYPAGQKSLNPGDVAKMDVPSTLFVDNPEK